MSGKIPNLPSTRATGTTGSRAFLGCNMQGARGCPWVANASHGEPAFNGSPALHLTLRLLPRTGDPSQRGISPRNWWPQMVRWTRASLGPLTDSLGAQDFRTGESSSSDVQYFEQVHTLLFGAFVAPLARSCNFKNSALLLTIELDQ